MTPETTGLHLLLSSSLRKIQVSTTLLGKQLTKLFSVKKPQIPMFLKLRLCGNKHKFCFSEFCKNSEPHSHSENKLKNQLLDKRFRPKLSQALLERERDFKRIHSACFERCREQTARSHAYRNRFKWG